MAAATKSGLRKELGLLSVYALATGATLSAGFFLLPGLAFQQAGPAIVICYMLAVIPLVPATFSIVELGSAMPRAGGAYYFLDRTMGPMVGTIGGLGTWIALMLKTAFALIGMGAYITIYFPQLPIQPVAAVLAIVFAVTNLVGAKKAGTLQIFLVGVLLLIMIGFISQGLTQTNAEYLANFWGAGWSALASTAGLVYISYVGVTNVASVSEEIKDPERNLPLGVCLAMTTAVVIYGLGTFVMVGTLPPEQFAGNLHPVADCAEVFAGWWGKALATIAALCAFFAVANAGILSSSRYPLAMSRDDLLPRFFRSLNSHKMPANSILFTLAIVLAIILTVNPIAIAKLASSFQLLLFAMLCLAVILMRESGLDSYDPGFRSPLYPWMQIVGIAAAIWLIEEMGALSMLFTGGLLMVGVVWFHYYGKTRVERQGAILHVFERLGRKRDEGLDRELRGIMKEKGLREQDPYEEVVIRASFLDSNEQTTFDELTHHAASVLADRLSSDEDNAEAKQIAEGFLNGTRVGATPVSHGAALPHLRLTEIQRPRMVIVRNRPGVHIHVDDPIVHAHDADEPIHAIFYLLSPEADPSQHLRILAQLASHIDEEEFHQKWLAASNERELREMLLREKSYVSLELDRDDPTAVFIDRSLRDVAMPKGCLVAVIRRGGDRLVPDGGTTLRDGDWITVIGEPGGIGELYDRYVGSRAE
jgi:amino acid transporter/mannitol/fructose-specific phosphotransferase system IIA component (Ntr-type)